MSYQYDSSFFAVVVRDKPHTTLVQTGRCRYIGWGEECEQFHLLFTCLPYERAGTHRGGGDHRKKKRSRCCARWARGHLWGSPGAFNHVVSRIVEVIDLVILRRRQGTGRGKTNPITLPRAAVLIWQVPTKGSFLFESFFPKLSTFVSLNFSMFHIFLFFFSNNYWNGNDLDFFASGEFHETWQNASVNWYISPIISKLWK